VRLGQSVVGEGPAGTLARPFLSDLARRTSETASLVVRRGDSVLFVETVEPDRILRVGNRAGYVLPAGVATGGRCLSWWG
jgi:IclR family transcriptional regulator, acetate operon repressor